MTFIDGCVAAVPVANKAAFIEHAEKAAKVFRDHGALDVKECWGVDVPDGEVTSFPMAVKKTDDEAIVFSWIAWPSKAARDAAWEKIMKDERMSAEFNPMPFDGKRMIFGGFETIVDA